MKTRVIGIVPDGIREKYLSDRIRESEVTQAQIAERAGIPPSTLNAMLKRGIAGSALDTVVRICDILNIDLNSFVRGEIPGSGEEYIQRSDKASRLHQTRVKLRYRLPVVAEYLRVPEAIYRKMEGGIWLISDEQLEQLAKLFGVSAEYLYCKTDNELKLNSELAEPDFDKNNAPYNYGLGIRRLRESLQMTRADFAERINRDIELVVDWEDDIRVPTAFDIANIATVFSVLPGTLCLTREQGAGFAEINDLIAGYKSASERDQQLVRILLGMEEFLPK